MHPLEQWLRATFPVEENGWHNADGTTEPQIRHIGRNGLPGWARLAWLVATFGGAYAGDGTTKPSAAALRAADPENATGWHELIDMLEAAEVVDP